MGYLLLVIAAAMFEVAAYGFYFKDTVSDSPVTPNRWSWLIWIFATSVEALTYNEVSDDPMKSATFFVSAACCIVVGLAAMLRAKWKLPDWTEVVSLVLSLVALGVWYHYHDVLGAHYIVVIALPITFWPAWRHAWKNFREEESPAWWLWTIGDLLAVIVVLARYDKPEDLPYAIMEFVCHGAMWVIVAYKRRRASIQ